MAHRFVRVTGAIEACYRASLYREGKCKQAAFPGREYGLSAWLVRRAGVFRS